MASPDAFRSSPLRGVRRDSKLGDSSPDLPPLQDIISQRGFRPPIKNLSQANHALDDDGIAASLTTARSAWKSVQAAEPLSLDYGEEIKSGGKASNADNSIEIIQIRSARTHKLKERKKNTTGSAVTDKKAKRSKSSPEDKPWKKYNSKEKKAEKDASNKESKPIGSKKCRGEKTGTTSNHFQNKVKPGASAVTTEPETPTQVKPTVPNEPLCIEPAMARRLDWTPPPNNTVISIDSDPSIQSCAPSSDTRETHRSTFRNLLQDYTCPQTDGQVTPQTSDEDSGFSKKRKLIELVPIADVNASAPVAPEKPPVKQKAPKKKPRTITALATAAYQPPTQPDPAPSTASLLEYFPTGNTKDKESKDETQDYGKGKTKPRKRASKSTKKKKKKREPSPEPILLSPGTALQQVANQDYVFGTSSQLAREQSPGLLRDLQAAMRNSNLSKNSFSSSINDDGNMPSEQRSKLWGAGARNAEGDLFDVEVIDLVDDSSVPIVITRATNAFGYNKDEHKANCPDPKTPGDQHLENNDLFVNLSDILPSPERPAIADSDSSHFSESDISVSTDVQRPKSSVTRESHQGQETASTQFTELQAQSEMTPLSRPNYELYSDVQLSKEITAYGFKPVKRRGAMIALLDQCWESKVRMNKGALRTAATFSTTSTKATTRTAESSIELSPKRPRGRPRKNSVSATEPQEPPPSAQPASSPQRPRGRPRKATASPTKRTATQIKTQTAHTLERASRVAPRQKKSKSQPVIEIPDSASENDSELPSSPCSSAEEMFSSPLPLDLSLGADTELSLTISPADQESAFFEHITKAITSAPRTTDPNSPSWHEKILLYDPIVLEDLTSWLNSGQLTRVGFDGEVSPTDVKKWCESKSVCCLWKVNLRGKERKRY